MHPTERLPEIKYKTDPVGFLIVLADSTICTTVQSAEHSTVPEADSNIQSYASHMSCCDCKKKKKKNFYRVGLRIIIGVNIICKGHIEKICWDFILLLPIFYKLYINVKVFFSIV